MYDIYIYVLYIYMHNIYTYIYIYMYMYNNYICISLYVYMNRCIHVISPPFCLVFRWSSCWTAWSCGCVASPAPAARCPWPGTTCRRCAKCWRRLWRHGWNAWHSWNRPCRMGLRLGWLGIEVWRPRSKVRSFWERCELYVTICWDRSSFRQKKCDFQTNKYLTRNLTEDA